LKRFKACISRVVNGKATKILPRGKEFPVGYKSTIYSLQIDKESSRKGAQQNEDKGKEGHRKRKESNRKFQTVLQAFLFVG
jgi:hypothetical protein